MFVHSVEESQLDHLLKVEASLVVQLQLLLVRYRVKTSKGVFLLDRLMGRFYLESLWGCLGEQL